MLLSMTMWVGATRRVRRQLADADVLLERAAVQAEAGEAFSPVRAALLPLLGSQRQGSTLSEMQGAVSMARFGRSIAPEPTGRSITSLAAFVKRGETTGPRDTTVTVEDHSGHRYDIVVPASWAGKLLPGSFRCISGGVSTGTFRARLAADPTIEVEIEKMTGSQFASHRACGIGTLVGHMPGVLGCYECQLSKETTFMLRQASDATLADLLKQRREEGEHTILPEMTPEDAKDAPDSFVMRLDESLLILVDILRGVASLESKGVVHGNLVEETILLHRGRAFVGDLARACVPTSSELGCVAGERFGTALRHAPEMIVGRPTGSSNSVWSVGLIFGAMLFGRSPTDAIVMRELPNTLTLGLDWNDRGREKIRAAVRDHFSIQRSGDFLRVPKEYSDVLELLAGMLEPDETCRWSLTGALQQAEQVAKARRIAVPSPEIPPALPASWLEEWQ